MLLLALPLPLIWAVEMGITQSNGRVIAPGMAGTRA